jgi:2-iminoacetate synthase
MSVARPAWLDPEPWLGHCRAARREQVLAALASRRPGEAEFAALISPAAEGLLEALAVRAREQTRRHFGRTLSLYAPLYLSNFCEGGCAYCGFAGDRDAPRLRLEPAEAAAEVAALKAQGFEDVLLLTGERTPRADYDYLLGCVQAAARSVHTVGVEAFSMTSQEYGNLAGAGCSHVTLYQETYDPAVYEEVHRWGPKRDYLARLEAPERALAAGVRVFGLGALLGLAEPLADMISLYRHAERLRRRFWRSGIALSFPRICGQRGDFRPPFPVSARRLAQFVWAFRTVFPDVPLTLSTRESAAFRDGMAGVGISRMSAGSRTTVGGYRAGAAACAEEGQFAVSDTRSVERVCAAFRAQGLEPVFKNWDAVFEARTAPDGDSRRPS